MNDKSEPAQPAPVSNIELKTVIAELEAVIASL
jgi:hypothetical protein